MSMILHLVSAAEFHGQLAREPYRPAGFDQDGFIHCTQEPDVLLHIANAFFREAPGDFLVLVIDSTRVTAPVRFEPPVPPPPDPNAPLARHLFPHIYGPLNRDAIVAVRRAQRAADGTFLAV
jgi:hypothetical protein